MPLTAAGVEEALRTLDPKLQNLALVGGGSEARAYVSLAGVKDPVPLGTLGEGATRMLTLALMLVSTRGGFVFIDEIESGLHYSVHRDLWRMVVETAKRLDIQVFATTHSKDVLEAIARLYEETPALAEEITVYRLEAGAPTAVRMTAATIVGTVEGQVDVR